MAFSKGVPLNAYSVFVNGRSRPVIMADMQQRIDHGDIQQEKQDAIKVKAPSFDF